LIDAAASPFRRSEKSGANQARNAIERDKFYGRKEQSMVSSFRPSSIDPLVVPEPPPPEQNADLAEHIRTYNRFIAIARSFVLHMAILLPALYFAVIGENPPLASVLVLVSVGVLIGGFLMRRPIRDDVKSALAAGPGSWPRAHEAEWSDTAKRRS
jgi:hypothetical protein